MENWLSPRLHLLLNAENQIFKIISFHIVFHANSSVITTRSPAFLTGINKPVLSDCRYDLVWDPPRLFLLHPRTFLPQQLPHLRKLRTLWSISLPNILVLTIKHDLSSSGSKRTLPQTFLPIGSSPIPKNIDNIHPHMARTPRLSLPVHARI